MKRLSTIAALLISLSVYSQDFIDYENLSFSQNGEILQLDEVKKLTWRYRAGFNNFRKAEANLRIVKYPLLRLPVIAEDIGLILLGPIVAAFGSYDPSGPVPMSQSVTAVAVGALSTGFGCWQLLDMLSTNKKITTRADNQFEKAAEKLNKAIRDANQ